MPVNSFPDSVWQAIRFDYESQVMDIIELSATYGPRPSTIQAKIRRESWKKNSNKSNELKEKAVQKVKEKTRAVAISNTYTVEKSSLSQDVAISGQVEKAKPGVSGKSFHDLPQDIETIDDIARRAQETIAGHVSRAARLMGIVDRNLRCIESIQLGQGPSFDFLLGKGDNFATFLRVTKDALGDAVKLQRQALGLDEVEKEQAPLIVIEGPATIVE